VVVFAYHQVGFRCLSVLLAHGVDVRLVLTHGDNPHETIWWQSVAALARRAGIPVITPEDPNTAAVIDQVRRCRPQLIFSFYYRHMLSAKILEIPAVGCFNMHGSLLPKYRGRVPVNWALLHGESESGVTLHRMEVKPDAGHLLDQQMVKILANDTAHDLFLKLVCAAETVMQRALPGLLSGSFEERPMDLHAGSYFGGRKPEDGLIDWSLSAWEIHNLIRAVAPPYPGAFTQVHGECLKLLGSYWRGEAAKSDTVRLYWESGRCYADCADAGRIELTSLEFDGEMIGEKGFNAHFGAELPLYSCRL
jgi:methionyl-tRNA formyltransferase